MKKSRIIGFVLGIVIAFAIHFLPIQGISGTGKDALALTLMTIIFWVFNIAHNGFVALLYCALVIILKVAEPSVVFASWLKPTFWMVIASFLLAAAANNSGITERIANLISLKLIRGYKSLIITIALLNTVLALIIPNVFPRSFLVYSIVKKICKATNASENDTLYAGFAVFALAMPSILMFLTADSSLNYFLLGFAQDSTISWMGWFIYNGIPALIAMVFEIILFLFLFRPSKGSFQIDPELFRARTKEMGKLSGKEIKTIVWIVILIVFWMTDSLHGIDTSFGTVIAVMLMTFPGIGNLITFDDWKSIPISLLCFLTGCMAIGAVGNSSGMNEWIAKTIMPSTFPNNPMLLALFISVVVMVLHILIGSTITIVSVSAPIFLSFTANMGINPMCILFLIYNALLLQYFFTFQQLTLTSGVDLVGYKTKHTAKIGIPLIAVVLIVNCLICIPWWSLTGFLS